MLKFGLGITAVVGLYYVVMIGYDVMMNKRPSVEEENSFSFSNEDELAEAPTDEMPVKVSAPTGFKETRVETNTIAQNNNTYIPPENEGIDIDAFEVLAKDKSKLAMAGFDFD